MFIYLEDFVQGVEVVSIVTFCPFCSLLLLVMLYKHFYGSTRLQIRTKKTEPIDIRGWLKKLLCFEFAAALPAFE